METPAFAPCRSSHQQLVAGRCPWCGAEIWEGQTIEEWLKQSFTASSKLDERDARMEMLSAIGIVHHREDDLSDLLTLLNSADHAVRQAAAMAIGSMGPVATDAIDNLARLLNDEMASVRAAAREAIAAILARKEQGTDSQADGRAGSADGK